jgi:hypothetical protein
MPVKYLNVHHHQKYRNKTLCIQVPNFFSFSYIKIKGIIYPVFLNYIKKGFHILVISISNPYFALFQKKADLI